MVGSIGVIAKIFKIGFFIRPVALLAFSLNALHRRASLIVTIERWSPALS
jgi:hypothetical protein